MPLRTCPMPCALDWAEYLQLAPSVERGHSQRVAVVVIKYAQSESPTPRDSPLLTCACMGLVHLHSCNIC